MNKSTCKDCKAWRDVRVPGYGVSGQCTKWKTDDGAFMHSSHSGYCHLFDPTDERIEDLRTWWRLEVITWPEWKRALASQALNKEPNSRLRFTAAERELVEANLHYCQAQDAASMDRLDRAVAAVQAEREALPRAGGDQ